MLFGDYVDISFDKDVLKTNFSKIFEVWSSDLGALRTGQRTEPGDCPAEMGEENSSDLRALSPLMTTDKPILYFFTLIVVNGMESTLVNSESTRVNSNKQSYVYTIQGRNIYIQGISFQIFL